jgi:type IV pilus assembly protein PilW
MRRYATPGSARGFSIIELMIALALGVVIIAGIVQLFVANDRTYSLLNAQSRLQESGRFAFDFIKEQTRSSGFFGCGPKPENIVKELRGTWPMLYEFDVTTPVLGYDGNADGTWSPSLAVLPRTEGGISTNTYVAGTGVDTTVIQPGTDVLVVRRVRAPETSLMQVLQPLGDPVVAAPGGDPGFATGDIVVLADCQQAAVFRITNLVVAGNQATVLHATSALGNPYENATVIDSPTGPIPATLSFLGRSYGEDASIGAVETTIFFIAPGAGVNNRGDAPLSLWRRSGTTDPVELVSGIDDMQLLAGIDTTPGDGETNINRYVPFDLVPDPLQIVGVRVTLTVSSVDVVENNAPLRRIMSETILLRNVRTSV